MKFIAFIFGWWVYRPYSKLVSFILRIKGIKVGQYFYIQGVPYLKIRGKSKNIEIGSNVSVLGDIDLRNRENGKIRIHDNVSIDTSSRFVAANDAVLTISSGCKIGPYCIFNCGTDIFVGEDTLVAGFCYIQSSNHGINKNSLIKNQQHTYGKITVGHDVWLGGHVSVLPGVSIGEGAVVGAKSVVTKNLPSYSISVGIPANVISERFTKAL
jgi:acetyltransferase-like isoleucine patch superfamily enzyme